LTVEGHDEFPADRALARIPDPQGLGGSLSLERISEVPTAEVGRRDDLL